MTSKAITQRSDMLGAEPFSIFMRRACSALSLHWFSLCRGVQAYGRRYREREMFSLHYVSENISIDSSRLKRVGRRQKGSWPMLHMRVHEQKGTQGERDARKGENAER